MNAIWRLSGVVALSLVLVPSSALADEEATLIKTAKKACLVGDVRNGVEILAQLYVDTGNAVFLYNQARCYEQNHRWQEAIDAFREYLRKVQDSPEEITDAEKHIAECEAFMNRERGSQPMPVTAPIPVQSASTVFASGPDNRQHGTLSSAASLSATTGDPTPPTSDGSRLAIVGLALGGVGVAATVAGVLLNLKANSLADELNDHYSRSKATTQSSYETAAWVSYGVGAAAFVAGGTVFAIGLWRGKSAPGHLSLLPVIGSNQSQLLLQGAF